MSTNGISAGHRSLSQIGMTPALPTVASPATGVSGGTATTYAGPVDDATTYATDEQYAAAVNGAVAGGGAAAQPVQWDESVRARFAALGLSANQVAQVESLGLSADEVQQAFNAIQADPTIVGQIPDEPVSAVAAVETGSTLAASTGPAAWNEEWYHKFQQAGAPVELLQQLMITGANGADAAMLQASLDQVAETVNTEISKFRAAHGEAYDKLVKAHTDKATLYQVASAVNGGQVSDEQLAQIAEQAGSTGSPFSLGPMLKQILPWSFIPGWGAIRFAIAPFFDGKDPFTGDKVHYDFWRHGVSGWSDALFAVGGAFSLAMTIKGGMQLLKGMSAIDSAHGAGLIGNVARAEGLVGEAGTMSLGKKLMAVLPVSSENRAVTGIARLGELEKGVAALPEGSAARASLENYLEMLGRGDARIGSKAGIGNAPFGLGTHARGAVLNRKSPMVQLVTTDGASMLKLDGRLTSGPALTAHVAAGAVDFLPQRQLAELMSAYGVASPELLRTKLLAEAGTALGITAEARSPLNAVLGAFRPGPVEDVLKAVANRPPSTLSTIFRSPLGIMLGVGAASAGAMMFMRRSGSGEQAEAATSQQQSAAAAGQLQLTADEQAAVQQFLALPVDQQQQVATQIAQGLQQARGQQLTAEQQAQLDHQAQVLQLMVELAGQQLAQPQAG